MNADELHAFADHEVMQACLDGIDGRRLTREEALEAIGSDPDWIPAAVEPTKKLIYFVNVGQSHLDRWQFVYSIHSLATEDPTLQSFSVSFDVLEDLELDGLTSN
ncbi:MAG: hypothetical protein OEU92_21405 [Alphaproteobacteria bacterium]|nr:hypothetical protein [Alphaproteobacteria bacterium]